MLKRYYYPRSFLKLIFAGFSLVALPLIVVLIANAISVDQLANHSEKAVYQAVQATQNGRALVEQINAMERSARQFLILGDASMLEAYTAAHKNFKNTAWRLSSLPLDSAQRGRLEELVAAEQVLYDSFSETGQSPEKINRIVGEFVKIFDLARAIVAEGDKLIDLEAQEMQVMAERIERVIFWQLLAMIPVALFLVVGFTLLIAKPIRQIDEAIRLLGDGQFDKQITVNGPQDLEYLGDRLNWMRLRLVALEEQKNKFLRHISHELKTPLTALREGAELLHDQAVGPLNPQQREIAQILQSNSIRLQKLIEDLLNYHAAQFQKFDLSLSKVSIKPVIEQVVESQRLAVLGKDLKLNVECPDITAQADEEKIRVIVDNLLSNAIKFSPHGATIEIGVRQLDDKIVMDFIDAGPGIAPDEREKVYEAFYQGQAEQEGVVKGSGLGLSIVKEYVTAHHGVIGIVDAALNGAHFRVVLPTEQGAHA
jgi:two-component system sensor histidine kinase GlrK